MKHRFDSVQSSGSGSKIIYLEEKVQAWMAEWEKNHAHRWVETADGLFPAPGFPLPRLTMPKKP